MTVDPRQAYRQMMLNAWQAHQAQKALSPLEQQIVAVLQAHPEYQSYFNGLTSQSSQASLSMDYDLADNPFFHISLHISLNEQIQLDRPSGIRALYFAACKKTNEHDLQHQMMQVLAETLFTAQKNGAAPDETDYLNQLKHLLA